MCRAYVWPRPGGSCRCTKVGALLFTPLLLHGQSEPRPRPQQAGQRREAGAQGNQSDAKTERHKEQEGEVDSTRKTLAGAASAAPVRALPGQLARRQKSEPPLSPRVPTPPTNHIGTKAREAPLWWHAYLRQDHERTRSDEDQKTTIVGEILVEDIHETPGTTLAGDDHGAAARPLPRTLTGPRLGPRLPRLHRRSHAATSSTSWAGTCVAACGLYADSASTGVVACKSS